MEKSIIILRGIPGCGKSSFAELLGTDAICCADDYFMRDGKYEWKQDDIGKAHEWCQRKCKMFLKANVEKVVIANTNTTEREMRPYFNLGREFGYKVYSVIIENRHGNSNIHDVPDTTIEKMKSRFSISL